MKQRLFALILFQTIILSVLGQIKITGNIVDASTSETVEFVNISLLKSDSTFVKGVVTNEKGSFVFNNINPEDYILCAAYIGYNKSYTAITNTKKNLDLGVIPLHTSEIGLKEVTVTGKSVIYKADRQVIMPNETQVKASNNGLKLLQNLNLARITVDPMTNNVSLRGGDNVQLRINGVKVTKDEVIAIIPEDIIRVEYHDDPGLRYNNAGAVINFNCLSPISKLVYDLIISHRRCCYGLLHQSIK